VLLYTLLCIRHRPLSTSVSSVTCNPLLPLILHALPRLCLTILDPLVVRASALRQFRLHDALHQLAHKAHEVVPPQRILPQPGTPLLLLLFQRLLVADLARTDTLVLHAGEQVEADFCGGVAVDAALKHRNDGVGEVLRDARAVGDGGGLEAVEFVEGVVHRRISAFTSACVDAEVDGINARDEVVHVVVFCSSALRLVDERRGSRKRVVYFADDV
jgi:hypothetical protein